VGRKKKSPPERWFSKWYEAMPATWQAGLHEAVRGGAFMGELLKFSGEANVVVFFVHPSLAEQVRRSIEGRP